MQIFPGTEGKALHKPDVCEAKHAKQNLRNKTKRKRGKILQEPKGKALHKPEVCEAKHA